MNIFVIEDEKVAMRNLQSLIGEVSPAADIVGEADSVSGSIEWLKTHDMPDLIFMDIYLADGSAFEIFEHVSISCPVVFTTAYNEYALRAFKYNGIDYLLKPINRDDLATAFEKLNLFKSEDSNLVDKIIRQLSREERYKTHFLVPDKGDKYVPLAVDSIVYFYIADGVVKALDNNNRYYILSQSLEELNEQLDPQLFFRANRQYLISKKAIKDVGRWFNGRLTINMIIPTPSGEKIVISKAKTAEFKKWF